MKEVSIKSVICKTCNMPASVDVQGNCEFHRIRQPAGNRPKRESKWWAALRRFARGRAA